MSYNPHKPNKFILLASFVLLGFFFSLLNFQGVKAADTVIFLYSTSTSPWTVPGNWSAVNQIVAIGGGGGGGTTSGGTTGSGGGAGGDYASSSNFSFTIGSSILQLCSDSSSNRLGL